MNIGGWFGHVLVGCVLAGCSGAGAGKDLMTEAPSDPSAIASNGDTSGNGTVESEPGALPEGAVETVAVTCRAAGDIVVGDGHITRTTRDVRGFTKIATRIAGEVAVREGTVHRVQIETDSNLQANFEATVDGDTLSLDASGNVCAHRIRVTVTLPTFRAASLIGAAGVTITKKSTASDVDLAAGGAGSMAFTGRAKALVVRLTGSGNVALTNGSALSTAIEITGSGDIEGSDFSPGVVTKKITGSGAVTF